MFGAATVDRYLLPRNSLLWLMVSQSMAIAPLTLQLPVWLVAVWLVVVVWRLQEFRGHWQMPGRLTKVALVMVCVAGLFSSFGRVLGLEPMVALLVCALLLKQLEVQRRKDALVLVYLTFFLIGVQFLFTQTLLASLYAVVCLWLALVSLLSMNQPTGHQWPRRSIRLAGRLIAHSIPLMVLLFLIMPRLGNLWAIPNLTKTAKTGVSDSMSPGDFSQLSRAGGVAFRVAFEGGVNPRLDQLYWRGLVFSAFDGRRWQQARPEDYRDGAIVDWQGGRREAWRDLAVGYGDSIDYTITLEPTQQLWLYSLTLPSSFEDDTTYGLARDFRLLSREPVSRRIQYRVSSQQKYQLEASALPAWRLERELQLPEGFNPKAREQAKRWREQADSEQGYIDVVLANYRDNFYYTLEPGTLGRHSVDEFMWQSRRGFCEHFASSFVVMMRAAGIPARVVVGYLGGEYNASENYWVVHQYDAHAWSEVWLADKGWVRVDPTAAVAPERVLQSLGDLRADSVEGLLSLGRYRHWEFVAKLRMQWDGLNYRWHRAVMGFDKDSQSDLLNRWLGGVTPLKMVLVVLFAGSGVLLLATLHLWWQSRPASKAPADRYYHRFERLLRRKGWTRRPGEAAGDFARRVAQRQPLLEPALTEFNALYEGEVYRAQPVERSQWLGSLARIKVALRQV